MHVMHKASFVLNSKPLRDIQEEVITYDANGKRRYQVHKRSKGNKKITRFRDFKTQLLSKSLSGRSVFKLISSLPTFTKQTNKNPETRTAEKRKLTETISDDPACKVLKLDNSVNGTTTRLSNCPEPVSDFGLVTAE